MMPDVCSTRRVGDFQKSGRMAMDAWHACVHACHAWASLMRFGSAAESLLSYCLLKMARDSFGAFGGLSVDISSSYTMTALWYLSLLLAWSTLMSGASDNCVRGVAACTGPNGCGKSTFLRLVMGREQPIKGTVDLGEHAIQPNYFEQNQVCFLYRVSTNEH